MNSLTTAVDGVPDVADFCMYDLLQLLQILNQLNSINDLANRLKKLQEFLATYSLYQSLVYLRTSMHNVNDLLKPYFTVKASDFLEFHQVLKNLACELHGLMRRNQQADYTEVRRK